MTRHARLVLGVLVVVQVAVAQAGSGGARLANSGADSGVTPPAVAAESASGIVVFSDDFEGAFPGVWRVDRDAGSADTEWGKVTCNAASGTGSAWCGGGGAVPLAACTQYIDSMSTRMVAGPFSLADALTAAADFDLSYDTEACCDAVSFGVSVDGTNFTWTDYAGSSGGWVEVVWCDRPR